MTRGRGDPSVVHMKKPRISHNLLLAFALSAVFSLAFSQGLNLVSMTLGNAPHSAWAISGAVAGLIGCAASAWFGLRHINRCETC